jgi:hypothetical protein
MLVGRYRNKLCMFNRKVLSESFHWKVHLCIIIVCSFSFICEFICRIILLCKVCPYLNKEPVAFYGRL